LAINEGEAMGAEIAEMMAQSTTNTNALAASVSGSGAVWPLLADGVAERSDRYQNDL